MDPVDVVFVSLSFFCLSRAHSKRCCAAPLSHHTIAEGPTGSDLCLTSGPRTRALVPFGPSASVACGL